MLLHDASPWFSAATPSEEWDRWSQTHDAPWNRPVENLYFNLAQLALRASVGDSGIALGRALIVATYLADDRLVSVCDDATISGLRYFVLVRDLSPAVPAAAFVHWLGATMAGTAADSEIDTSI